MQKLETFADPAGREGMARFGIDTSSALGINVTRLRPLARALGRDHALAEGLWTTGVHEARILASMVDDPQAVTERQMEAWAADFNSWDLVDQCCGNLFARTPMAWAKAVEWSGRREQFVKRAGFSLMAYLAVHAKREPDRDSSRFCRSSSARRPTSGTSSRRL